MSDLDSIIRITLTRASQPVATASFQIPLILATFTNFAERTRVYESMTQVAEDFDSTDSVYVIASKLFGQSGVGAVPPSIVVGRRQVDSISASIGSVANNTEYSVTINGNTYTITSDADASALEIVAALDTAVTDVEINFTDNEDGTFSVAPVTPGEGWSFSASSNITVGTTAATETWVEALDAVTEDNDSWYLLIAETHVAADQEALSDAIGAVRKIYGVSTSDTVAPTAGTTDIGAVLSAKSAGRTYGVYLPTANSDYPEAAWAGAQLAYTPGSNDWDFKRVNGVTVSKLSATAKNNLREKNYNFYTEVGGVNIFQDGNMFDGLPIDEQIVIDWLYARLQESIYFRLINSLKIPMTNPGLAIIENEIRTVLSQAEANGAIDRGWSVSVPDVLSIPENLRAQRTAGVFVFRARLAGSIRKVEIEGYLSV